MRGAWLPASALLLAASTACGGAAPASVDLPPQPAPTAGPLTSRQMPSPAALGAGWAPDADDETAVAGAAAEPASTRQREVGELLEGLTPVGCPEAAVEIALPRPAWALEGTYVGPAGAPGVSLVLEFPAAAGAAGFLAGLADQAQACPLPAAPPGGDDPLGLSFTGVTRAADQVSALRQEHGVEADPNRYLVVAAKQGRRVGLVFLAGADPAGADRIAAGLRASVDAT